MCDIVAICDICKASIDDFRGLLYVDMDDVRRVEDAWTAHEKANPHGSEIRELASLPDRAKWYALHDACGVAREHDIYPIELGALTNMRQLVSWTAHLLEKTWLNSTNWDDVLRSVAQEGVEGPLRVSN
ncbi:hypothetical protein [Phytohabitans rumicis]|uniref:Uncharacterized protein n=1 Tax=Phytohabitans rumicis TaxID=1076125 RepID=A0A6V8LEM2_9ACTN|nr:hypothetical protein [Phytohabitans rumicis]GFJ93398.1 hypothetical protein Prum_070400 [Phytohabitans rumicis]